MKGLENALQLHAANEPFGNERLKMFMYQMNAFARIREIVRKQVKNKQVIVGFGNWGNPIDSIYCDISGAWNIYVLRTKMIQREK